MPPNWTSFYMWLLLPSACNSISFHFFSKCLWSSLLRGKTVSLVNIMSPPSPHTIYGLLIYFFMALGFFIPGFPKLHRFQAHHELILSKMLPKLKKHLVSYRTSVWLMLSVHYEKSRANWLFRRSWAAVDLIGSFLFIWLISVAIGPSSKCYCKEMSLKSPSYLENEIYYHNVL